MTRSQPGTDAHGRSAAGPLSPGANPDPAPNLGAPRASVAAEATIGAIPTGTTPQPSSSPEASVAATPMVVPPRADSSAPRQDSSDAQGVSGASDSSGSSGGGATVAATPTNGAPRPEDALLLFYADILDDLERTRIANENRLRSLTSEEEWGKGAWGPEVDSLRLLIENLAALEHGAELNLRRAMRRHPLGAWVKRTVGVGEKQAARLLAAIGDPAARPNPAKLWAFCGLHVEHPGQPQFAAHLRSAGVAPRRRKGQMANWSTKAKMRAYNVAESCMKQRTSPYRAVYDKGREKYAHSVHVHDCPPCHAKAGEPLKLGHQHMRAMRLVMKAVLLDLWKESTGRGSA